MVKTAYPIDAAERETRLTASEEKELGRLIQKNHDQKAREKLVLSNIGLVKNAASHYMGIQGDGHGLVYEDVVQNGVLGLIVATDKYDPDRGNRFSTVATWWIRQAIQRADLNTSRQVTLPVHVERQLSVIEKAEYNFMVANGGTKPTCEIISQITGLPSETIRTARRGLYVQPQSLDGKMDVGVNRDPLPDLTQDDIPSETFPSPEQSAENSLLHRDMLKLLRKLKPRNRKIIKKLFGIGTYVHTRRDITEEYGFSRERVRQIINKSLVILRKAAIREREWIEN